MDVGGCCGFACRPLPAGARGKKYREKQDGGWQEEKGAREEEEETAEQLFVTRAIRSSLA